MIHEIMNYENIAQVIKDRRKRSVPDEDGIIWNDVISNKAELIAVIQKRLEDYHPQPVREIQSSGRKIVIPTLEERLLQLSISRILSKRIQWYKPKSVFKFVTGERALEHFYRQYKKRFGPIVCHADIEKYFDSIDHDEFAKFLLRYIGDKIVVALISKILTITPKGKGLLVGHPLAVYLADRFLVTVDDGLACYPIVRFHDDYFYFTKTKDLCLHFITLLRDMLHQQKLRINQRKLKTIENPLSYRDFYE